jgi:hypothetical protein
MNGPLANTGTRRKPSLSLRLHRVVARGNADQFKDLGASGGRNAAQSEA